MIAAASLKAGGVVRLENEFHKVVESITHSGGGKAGSMVHAKLRNLSTGHISERRFNPDEKLDDVPVTRARMQFLYREGDSFHFMNPETYDQIPIQKSVIGPAAAFLKENDEIEVEFHEEKPLSVLFPAAVELGVSSTGAGLRGRGDSPFKEAALENGLTVLVPQFIKEGDRIRVEVETGKYLERVTDREAKGARFEVAAPAQKAQPNAQAPPGPKPDAKPGPPKKKP